MKELLSVSPLKILKKSSRKELGEGNMGVLMARAGLGKTTCLIHMAFDNIFKNKKLVHVSVNENPEKVMSYYSVIYTELEKAMGITNSHEIREKIEKDRMILAYLNESFDINRLRATLRNMVDELNFIPATLILDGLDFEKTARETLEGIKDIAGDFRLQVWFSALSHRHIKNTNERGIPYPCDRIDDLFSIIMQVQPIESGIYLQLLKDHDNETIEGVNVKLDPETFLSME